MDALFKKIAVAAFAVFVICQIIIWACYNWETAETTDRIQITETLK